MKTKKELKEEIKYYIKHAIIRDGLIFKNGKINKGILSDITNDIFTICNLNKHLLN